MKEKEVSALLEFSNFLLLQVFTEYVVSHLGHSVKTCIFFEK